MFGTLLACLLICFVYTCSIYFTKSDEEENRCYKYLLVLLGLTTLIGLVLSFELTFALICTTFFIFTVVDLIATLC